MNTPEQEINRFLTTGDHDGRFFAWPGDWLAQAKQGDKALRQALIAAVKERTKDLPAACAFTQDMVAFTRAKVQPMVAGLFAEGERQPVLSMLEKSVVFLTGENIETILLGTSFLHTAWSLANLYLLSMDAELLSDTAPRIVGLSEETTCYVCHRYFVEKDKFADFLVHEAAHVFHNCKRETVGLPETRTRQFLLNIDFNQRETFAYACEAYSRILEMSHGTGDRVRLVEEIKANKNYHANDDRLNREKFWSALAAAARARNGWKKILQACAPAGKSRAGSKLLVG